MILLMVTISSIGCAPKPLPSVSNVKEEVFVPEKIRDATHMRSLLDRGLNPNIRNKSGTNQDWMLTYAVRNKAHETIELLIERGADVGARTEAFKKTPLFQAAFEGDIEGAKILIKHGADVNATDVSDNNPLREAISAHHPAMVEYLLKAGCNPNQRNSADQSMRDLADKYGDAETKSLLLGSSP